MPAGGEKAAFFSGGTGALTAGYRPGVMGGYGASWLDQRAWFSWPDVPLMIRDSRICLGLRIIRAPLHTITWEVQSESEAVKAYVDRTLRFVWDHHLIRLLTYLEYGTGGGELVWRIDEQTGMVELDDVRDASIWDLTPLVNDKAKLSAVCVRGVTGSLPHHRDHVVLCGPRFWWLAHEPRFGSLYGKSRLAGAWLPWQEKTARHGALAIRRLWYVKNAFRGGKLRYPEGATQMPDGSYRNNQDLAREIGEKVETGGILTMPNTVDPENPGKYLWEYEDPVINGELRDVREYPKDLNGEMLEGIGVPIEVVNAAESGSGWAGRTVPFLVFLTGEDQIVTEIIHSMDERAIRPAVHANFGAVPYTIKAKSLVPPDVESGAKQRGEGGGEGNGQQSQADQGPGQQPTPQQAPQAPQQPQQLSQDAADKADPVRLAGEPQNDPWQPYKGTRGARKGQTGWKNTNTGRVMWGEKPGGKTTTRKAPLREKKATADEVHAHLAEMMASPHKITGEQLHQFAENLLSLSPANAKALRERLAAGGKVTKASTDLAAKIAEKALGTQPQPEVKPEPKAEPKPTPAPKKGAAKPSADDAAAQLRGLYDRATDATLTHEQIEREVMGLDKSLDAAGMKAVARAFGISSGLISKTAATKKILAKITERKGRAERGEEIARLAKPKVDEAKLDADIAGAVGAWDKHHRLPIPVERLHELLAARHPGLTPEEFKGALGRLYRSDTVAMGEYPNSHDRLTPRQRELLPESTHLGIPPERGTGRQERYDTVRVGGRPHPAPAPFGLDQLAARFDPATHLDSLVKTVKTLDKHGSNLVDIADVRDALPHLTHEQQDAVIHEARKRGLISGAAYEGRHGTTERQRRAIHRGAGGDEIGHLSIRRD